ncbi:MAG: branched-chain amino acid aminotransferase [Cyclobacteriaceae bacterium]|nr:branched-chain amino acid aminotransferase [Cyclobacteriaceae bacterium]
MTDTLNISIEPIDTSRLSQVDFNHIDFGKVYSDHMFIADYYHNAWQNLRIEPYDMLSFTPGSAILHYGQSVFEGMKAYKNAEGEVLVFRPEKNFMRLNLSAERMCIPQLPEDIFMQGLTQLLHLDKNWVPDLPNTSLYIRPYIFALDEFIGIRPSDNYKFIIFTCPVGPYYSRPLKVKIERQFSRAVHGGTGYAKAAGNYAGSLYPAKLAQQKGYDQLIWTDGATHQYVEEAGTMNVMFIKGNKLITAETGDTVLKGITRDSVLTIAKEWGYEVEERRVSVDELVKSLEQGEIDEAFGTGTAATIASIEVIGDGHKDYQLPITNAQSFSKRVFAELDQIKTGKKEDKYGWIYKV